MRRTDKHPRSAVNQQGTVVMGWKEHAMPAHRLIVQTMQLPDIKVAEAGIDSWAVEDFFLLIGMFAGCAVLVAFGDQLHSARAAVSDPFAALHITRMSTAVPIATFDLKALDGETLAHRSEGQGCASQFLGDLVRAVQRGNAVACPAPDTIRSRAGSRGDSHGGHVSTRYQAVS